MTRLTESFKLQMKKYRRSEKKRESLRTFPRCSDQSEKVVVLNSLDPDKKYRSEIVEIGKFGRHGYSHVIIKIKCPLCKRTLEINKFWVAFICNEHTPRKIWEVVHVYEKSGEKFV